MPDRLYLEFTLKGDLLIDERGLRLRGGQNEPHFRTTSSSLHNDHHEC
jgi:hypothetical protein